MTRSDFHSVDHYIASQPDSVQPILQKVRATIRQAVPGATEGISYRIPVYKVEGKMVLYFAAFKHHYAIYPATSGLMTTLKKELTGYLHNKATIRFPLDEVPSRLIARIAKLRAAEAKQLANTAKSRRAKASKVKRTATRKTAVVKRSKR